MDVNGKQVKKVARELKQSKWASMVNQVMSSGRKTATKS
jgi:hypothetical protein